jgi:hypothetical protein
LIIKIKFKRTIFHIICVREIVMYISKLLVASCFALLLTACGGGGGGSSISTPANPDAVFQTSSARTPAVGETLRFDLTGTLKAYGDSESVTGSISLSRKPNQVINNEEMLVVDLVLAVRIPSQGTTISSANTTYMKLDGSLVSIEQDDGVICYPDANYKPIPDTVKYGDAGVIGGSTCSDGTTLSAAYLVEVSDRNNAWAAIREYATYSEPGLDDIFEDIIFHITESGELKALDIFAGDGTVSFELSS